MTKIIQIMKSDGFGDKTQNLKLNVIIPHLIKFVALNIDNVRYADHTSVL